jgi:hypothetical protein
MKNSFRLDLIASLISSAVGISVWLFGLSRLIWPAHPQLAAFLLTIVTTVVVRAAWPVHATGPNART